MKKQLVFGLALVAVAASWGCNNEIEVEHRTFKQLCENSGGEINQDDNRYCKCGNPKADCAIGVVCYNNGEFCANNDRICDKINAELQTKICQNNIDNVGQIRICAKNQISADDADISYSYIDYVSIPNQSNIENEYKNEYNSGVNGECYNVSCYNDKCGECINGTRECKDTNGISGIYKCENGRWELSDRCLNVSCGMFEIVDKDSDNTVLESRCGECLNGDKKCDEGRKYVCEEAKWSDGVVCENGNSCNAAGTDCGLCINGNSHCENGILEKCINGVWSNAVACSNNASCKSDTVCGECYDGDKQCIAGSDGKNAVTQTCVNGSWNDDELKCKTSTCDVTGKLCGTCENGETKCLNNSENNDADKQNGYFYSCSNNEWIVSPCPNTSCNEELSACGECLDDENKCEIDKQYKCSGGSWGEGMDCNKSCNTDGKYCNEECREGETKCENSIFYNCVNGKWNEVMICPNNTSCKSDTVCGECHDGDKKCDIDDVYTCDKGQWGKKNACPEGVLCNVNGTECGICKEGNTICEDGIRSTCINGGWMNSVTCSNNVSCNKEKTDCGECNDEDVKCNQYEIGDGETKETKAVVVRCVDGKWPEETDVIKDHQINEESAFVAQRCGSSSCDLNGKLCGSCKDGNTQCIMGSLYTCNKGAWEVSSCPDNASCKSTTECGKCTNNDKLCIPGADESVKAHTETCFNGEWVEDVGGMCDSNKCDSHLKACEPCENNKQECVVVDGSEDSSTLRTCVDGKWEYMFCPSGVCIPQAVGGAYCQSLGNSSGETFNLECKNGDPIICRLGKQYQCVSNKYVVHETCSSGICLNDSDCALSCSDANGKVLSCSNDVNTNIGVKTICNNGLMQNVSCGDKSCNENSDGCGKDCINGYIKCHLNDKNKGYICNNGKWDSSEINLQVFFKTDYQIDNCNVLCPNTSGCPAATYKSKLGITSP